MKIFTYIKDNSTRIPRKNFKKIGGLPLWKHLLYEFSNYEIFIDTDSKEIIKECLKDGKLKNCHAYLREKKMIAMEEDINNNLSPVLLMTENFLDKFVNDENEIIIVMHVTSPFLKKETLQDALKFLKQDYEFIHSVSTMQDFAWLGENYLPINFNPSVVQRTQDLKKIYFSNGAFFIFTKKNFKKYKNRLGKKNYFYNLTKVESIEIDNFKDLEFAKIVYKGLRND